MKYSIIIPVHNSLKFLPTCISTIINQDYDDYELIISDDNSLDGTDLYLKTIDCKNLKIIHPDCRLTMVEHFEFALKHAKGEWVMFVGGDDGLQPYFFKLADKLVKIAEKSKIRAIMSERAYLFWPGCELLYGKSALSYCGIDFTRILNCRIQTLLSLLGFHAYFELPQMYTNSLFSCDLIEEVRQKNNGNVFSTIPPDSNLAAIACTLEKRYLKSYIPLGWIGTSPGGVLYSMDRVPEEKMFPNEYIGYDKYAGNFALRSCSLYYWNALIMTSVLRKSFQNTILMSKPFRTLILAAVLADIKFSTNIDAQKRMIFFDEVLVINKCNKKIVHFISHFFPMMYKLHAHVKMLYTKIIKTFNSSYQTSVTYNDNKTIDFLKEANNIRLNLLSKKIRIEN